MFKRLWMFFFGGGAGDHIATHPALVWDRPAVQTLTWDRPTATALVWDRPPTQTLEWDEVQ